MKSGWVGGVIGRLGKQARLLGHSARFRTLGGLAGKEAEKQEEVESVARVRARAVAEILKATAAALERREDRGVLGFDGWISFGEWAGFNCGRCMRCGVAGRRLGGPAPCAFLPRMLGRFITDGRMPIPVWVSIGGVMSGEGFELAGVPPLECVHIVRSWWKTSGGRVNDSKAAE